MEDKITKKRFWKCKVTEVLLIWKLIQIQGTMSIYMYNAAYQKQSEGCYALTAYMYSPISHTVFKTKW